jgi:hypothetical protein
VEVAEKFAERVATKSEITTAFKKANAAAWATGKNHDPTWASNHAALETPYAQFAADQLLAFVKSSGADSQRVEKLIVAWLRDIFGNPFRPASIDPAWQTSTVVSLAQAIYDDRAFDRMPALADALEDGGCDNQGILGHCRSGSQHVRGCWVVDLVLAKE